MKKKRLDRDIWLFDKYPYYQLRIDMEDFHGLVCLIQLMGGVAHINDGQEDNYKGYRFDAAYPEENEQALDFMKSIGAYLLDFDYELRLSKNEYESMAEIDKDY